MRSPLTLLLLPVLVLLAAPERLAADEHTWVYEGVITDADPALAPDLKSGWVLSGSFVFDPAALEEDPDLTKERSGRMGEGISAAELTVDLYYQIHFQALQVPGLAGFDYENDDPEADGRDQIGWFIPMHGKLKESAWSSRWLQAWLLDPEGEMIRSTPPDVPSSGFAWDRGWFRLVFVNESGEEAFAEGYLEFFGPEAQLEPEGEQEQWSAIVADLGNQLAERDTLIASMQVELEEARARVESLRRMVDLLVEERTSLQDENALLAEKAMLANPEVEEKLASLTAEKALAEAAFEDLAKRNLALAETLSESEWERRRLLRQIAELTALQEEAEETPLRMQRQDTVTSPDGRRTGTITVFEQPMVIEKPMEFPSTMTPQVPAPKRNADRRARFGPRKFR